MDAPLQDDNNSVVRRTSPSVASYLTVKLKGEYARDAAMQAK